MPTLREALGTTMAFQASTAANRVAIPNEQPYVAIRDVPPDIEAGAFSSELAALVPLWSWRQSWDDLDTITDIKCCTRSMGFAPMTVCTKIQWDTIKVWRQGVLVELPLRSEFLLHRAAVLYGSIAPANEGLWQLEARVDQSLVMAFGYNIGGQFLEPIEPAAGLDTVLMEGDRADVLVCVELVLCQERADFEPTGALAAARLYPHVLIKTSAVLDRAEVSLHLHRPLDGHQHSGFMSHEISAGYFTDSNSQRIFTTEALRRTLIPIWDVIFDYYEVAPTADLLPMVDPAKPQRVPAGVVRSLGDDGMVTMPITKLAGQGAFDSIHLAPKMRLLPAGDYDIVMAPVCKHDCLHTHWRWGSFWWGKEVKGWSANYQPYAVAGAAMVPPNQKINLGVERGADFIGFKYTAEIDGQRPGGELGPDPTKWHVVMHHGSAYAIDADRGVGLGLNTVLFTDAAWAAFYKNLSHRLVGGTWYPRLSWLPADYDHLRFD